MSSTTRKYGNRQKFDSSSDVLHFITEQITVHNHEYKGRSSEHFINSEKVERAAGAARRLNSLLHKRASKVIDKILQTIPTIDEAVPRIIDFKSGESNQAMLDTVESLIAAGFISSASKAVTIFGLTKEQLSKIITKVNNKNLLRTEGDLVG